jgi:phosphatidate phosphatase APP1
MTVKVIIGITNFLTVNPLRKSNVKPAAPKLTTPISNPSGRVNVANPNNNPDNGRRSGPSAIQDSISTMSRSAPQTTKTSKSRVSNPLVDQTATLRVHPSNSGAVNTNHSRPGSGNVRLTNHVTIAHKPIVKPIDKTFATDSGASPTALNPARITTHKKFVYPSTRSNPGLNTNPYPSLKFRAYRNEMNASSVKNA